MFTTNELFLVRPTLPTTHAPHRHEMCRSQPLSVSSAASWQSEAFNVFCAISCMLVVDMDRVHVRCLPPTREAPRRLRTPCTMPSFGVTSFQCRTCSRHWLGCDVRVARCRWFSLHARESHPEKTKRKRKLPDHQILKNWVHSNRSAMDVKYSMASGECGPV